MIKSIIRGWQNIFPGVWEGSGRLGEGEAHSDLQARETLTLASIYLFAKGKGGGGGVCHPCFVSYKYIYEVRAFHTKRKDEE